MRYLLAGGAGEVGRHLSAYLLSAGHEVVVLDRMSPSDWMRTPGGLTIIEGDLLDKTLVKEAAQGVDVIVNLAWSFTDDAAAMFRDDIGGHVNLLEAAVANKVKRFVYASSATVYGMPVAEQVTEEDPCLLHKARKPLYALGKYAAEQLCHINRVEKGLPVVIIRFWWAYGDSIGGRHLRAIIRVALSGEPVKVASGAGGTFVTMEDLSVFIAAAGGGTVPDGVYNIGSLFLTWSEIAATIIDETGSDSCLVEQLGHSWDGPAFLNEKWRLSWEKAERQAGFRPRRDCEAARQAFRLALSRCVEEIKTGWTTGTRG